MPSDPLQPAIKLLMDRAEKLRGEIEEANYHPLTTTITMQSLRLDEENACLLAANILQDYRPD